MSVLLIIGLLCAYPAITAAAGDGDSFLTVYEVLESYDFPVGLLPKGVTSYELDRSTGKFAVYLENTCSFTIQGYNLKYSTKVTGTISKKKIKSISGIQVKILFFWINIVEVTMDGDELYLSVGIASASFPVDNFEESPQCGCGFDCVNREKRGKYSFKSLLPLLEA
ncbi:hypothetical protein F511_03630 [Dorcoceras hygrometricum]|uniref:DUF538 domain-containing protein n=1 Tax=Dorcoceras hygrometricum TaxID=472368 RepID=A0A2Z7BE98_9LAMI|nr:hypothetical protein F511_03630 [Dorcoceras hygrometricum]